LVDAYVKRRDRPPAGSIPEALDSFRAEVRFYQEIAPAIDVRVPACYEAQVNDDGTVLVLEDFVRLAARRRSGCRCGCPVRNAPKLG
jgi:hypothetical protein